MIEFKKYIHIRGPSNRYEDESPPPRNAGRQQKPSGGGGGQGYGDYDYLYKDSPVCLESIIK